jgi:glutamyl-Q tRNA(Asp) synthetase
MAAALDAAGGSLSWREAGAGPPGETGTVAADPAAWGDVVLSRADAPASYALAVVVDDALQGITHVVRGSDLFHATSVQRLLQRLLRLPEPAYFHHRLVMDMDGRKLAKSTGSTALRTLRAEGARAEDIVAMTGLDLPD